MGSAEIPAIAVQCVLCPRLQLHVENLITTHKLVEGVTDRYVRSVPDKVADFALYLSEHDPDVTDEAELDRDEIAAGILEEEGKVLATLDGTTLAEQQQIAELQLGCKGLRRLTDYRDGVYYTIESCGSPSLIDNSGGTPEPVRLWRRTDE